MYVRNIGVLAPAGCPVGWWHADHRARPSKIGVLAPAGCPVGWWHADHRARPSKIAVLAPGCPAWVWHGDLRPALGAMGVLRQMTARPRQHRSCTGAGQAVRALTWARSEGRCSGQTQQRLLCTR